MTRVVVVEDHVLVRQSLVKSVSAEPGFEVAGEAGTFDEALELVERLRPDVLLLDVELPGGDGLAVATAVKASRPDTRVLFLTMHDDVRTIRQAFAIGADGFLPKTVDLSDLMAALRTVAAGGSYLSPSIARRVMDMAGGRNSAPGAVLTERELEILSLLASGLDHADVAAQIYVSPKTVKNHLTAIYQKLGVRTAAQAVAAAYRRGLVGRPLGEAVVG